MSVPKIEGKMVKPIKNKKLAEETVKKVKDTGKIEKEDYVILTKNDKIKDVAPEAVAMVQENSLGVPNSFYELSVENQNMLMFYLDPEFYNDELGCKTHMNVLASYVSAYLEPKEIHTVWKIEYVKDDDGVVVDVKKKIKNYKKYNEIKIKAMEAFHQNPEIHNTWRGLIELHFGVNPKDLLQNAILQDALYAENHYDKNTNRKMAMDMLGLGKDVNNGVQINVFEDGGGKHLAQAIKDLTDDDYIVTEDDLDV